MDIFENDKLIVGCSKYTWIDVGRKKVYKKFSSNKIEQLKQINKISKYLIDNGLPIEYPIKEVVVYKDNIVYEYFYHERNERDFEGGIYSPQFTDTRLKNCSAAFAKFQQLGSHIQVEVEPLDYPFCNTLEWIMKDDYLELLLGEMLVELKKNNDTEVIDELSAILKNDIENVRDIYINSRRGLCHGDFHSSNILFTEDEVLEIIDYGFWISHPLAFDFAIALEFWALDYTSSEYNIDIKKGRDFIKSYISADGPIKNFGEVKVLLPYAKLWSDTFLARKNPIPIERKLYNSFLRDRVISKIKWYKNHGDLLFDEL